MQYNEVDGWIFCSDSKASVCLYFKICQLLIFDEPFIIIKNTSFESNVGTRYLSGIPYHDLCMADREAGKIHNLLKIEIILGQICRTFCTLTSKMHCCSTRLLFFCFIGFLLVNFELSAIQIGTNF